MRVHLRRLRARVSTRCGNEVAGKGRWSVWGMLVVWMASASRQSRRVKSCGARRAHARWRNGSGSGREEAWRGQRREGKGKASGVA